MDYLEKYNSNPFKEAYWNIPEQNQGTISIVGGNAQSFIVPVKTAEFLMKNYPVKSVRVVLPDSLKGKLPPIEGLVFLPSTENGTFAEEEGLLSSFSDSNYNILIGDLSKNSITEKAIRGAVQNSDRPLIITRDAVDTVTTNGMEKTLLNEQIVIFASIAQLQKLFRAVYYPKMLLFSQSLIQIADSLHKFTLSYPIKIITLHNNQILIAENGKIATVPIEKSDYTPITFWNGEFAAKAAAMNLFNPNNFTKATVAAIFPD